MATDLFLPGIVLGQSRMEMRMRTKNVLMRGSVGAAGAILLASVASGAFADAPPTADSGEVDVTVDIADAGPSGALTLSVGADQAALAEDGSTEEFRQFTGDLPEVTVTDTRTEVPEGAYWYVTGQASEFVGTGDQEPIGADHLGWTPHLLTEAGGEVAPGNPVDTVLDEDGAAGLVGNELLALALDSGEAQAGAGIWAADADLVLKTGLDVAPGSYSAVLTLSLFEDAY